MKWSCECILYVFLAFLLLQCKEGAGTLYLPETLDRNYTVVFNDTITVKTSTVLLDSIPTSNRGSLLVGKYMDDKFGLVESRPSFQIIYGNGWSLDPEATYDSMELLMNYTGYYYGDTTKSQTIEVRRVLSDLKAFRISRFWVDVGLFSYTDLNSNGIGVTTSIYNRKSFLIDSLSVLGTRTYTPRPRSIRDTIRVRLDDVLGQDFFQKKLQASLFMTNPYQFLDYYFKGLSINSLQNSNIVGVDPNKIKIRIYYKQRVNDLLKRRHFDFLAVSDNSSYPMLLNYNKIISDRSGTSFANLTTKNEISSSLTNGESYIQSSVGIVTKITFPGLSNLSTTPGFKQLTSAQIVLEPVRDTYDGQHNLPGQLVLFTSNRNNLPIGPLQKASRSLNANIENGSGYTYVFPITSYVQSVVRSNTNAKDVVLLLSTPASFPNPMPSQKPALISQAVVDQVLLRDANIFGTVTRACIGNGQRANYRARLEVYYLKQNN